MAAPAFTFGFSMLVVSLFGGGTALLGLPPGERDPALLNCAPADSLVYLEWSSRGTGTPGAEGVDGLVADPEIVGFFTDVRDQIFATLKRESAATRRDADRRLGEHLPHVIETILTHPGCLYGGVDTDAVRDAQADGAPYPAILGGLRATAIVNAGEQADDFDARLRELLPLITGSPAPAAGLNRLLLAPLPTGGKLQLHREGTYFIVGLEPSVDRAIAGIKGDVKGIGEAPRFVAASRNADVARIGSLLWIDAQGLRQTAVKTLGPEGAMGARMLEMVAADKVDGVMSIAGIEEGQFTTRTFVETGGSTEGVLAFASGRALTAEDFAHVPAHADFVASVTVDVPGLLTALRTTLNNVDPGLENNLKATLDQLERELGFSLEDDFAAAFGQQWTLFDAPETGGTYLTAPMLSIEVKDYEKAVQVFAKLSALVRQALPGSLGSEFRMRGVFLEDGKFLDHQIYYINTIGDDVPLAPAFTLTRTHLLYAMHPQTIKAYLRWQSEKQPGFARFAERAPADGEVFGYSYFETSSLVRHLYGLVPWGAQMAMSQLQSEGFDLKILSLPSSRAIVPYMRDSHNSIARTKNGLIISGHSSLPVSPLGSIVLNLGLFTVRMSHAVEMQFDEAVPAERIQRIR